MGTGVVCRVHGVGIATGPAASAAAQARIQPGARGQSIGPLAATTSVVTSTTSSTQSQRRISEIQEVEGENDSLLERNLVFDRLVSGQESEMGEAPPTYDEALKRRSTSRSRSTATARSRSRLGIPGNDTARERAGSPLRRIPSDRGDSGSRGRR